MEHLSSPRLVAYAVLLSTIFSLLTSAAAGLTVRADLTHVDSGRGFTRRELLSRMAARSRARAASRRLHPRGGGGGGHPATATVVPAGNEYLIHVNIGTPPQRVALTLDTGSDLVWTQCASCSVCFDQPFPLLDPSASRTARPAACSDPICGPTLPVKACSLRERQCFYFYAYGDNSLTAGLVYRDTITFLAPGGGKGGVVAVPNLAFGCGDYNAGNYTSNESGIAGFGRGPQSLPSQLGVGRFSYCLTPLTGDKTSPAFLGTTPDDLRAHATGPVLSTPLVYNPLNPTFFYLSFKGITVGGTRLPIDESVFALRRDGDGGTVIDSGTSHTTFPQAVVDKVRSAFVAQVPLPVSGRNDTNGLLCFEVASKGAAGRRQVPKLVFHLAGADMDLPRENYIMDVEELMCLMVDGDKNSQVTLIGNYQQQNMHIVYDLAKNKLLFVPAQCDKL